ncbi:hypothetical protein V6N11_025103 [Hibiscus sabdariffa]|uniref:Uncharacterized protein n=1 Tax=Hibiscus sabdariffa TaxID=183260 RepID=A0ABR2QPF8_9ROSI
MSESMKVKKTVGRAIDIVVTHVKPLKAVKVKEAVVCTWKERAGNATVTEIDTNYMTSEIVAFDSLPRTTIKAYVPRLCLGVNIIVIIPTEFRYKNGVFQMEQSSSLVRGDINERMEEERRKTNSMKDATLTPIPGKGAPFFFSQETNKC